MMAGSGLVEDGGQFTEPTAGGTIGPIVNGTTLTMSPAKAFATGNVNHVTLISDVGRDEFNGGVYTNTP
jgi:para-nitrobenzyl esterase